MKILVDTHVFLWMVAEPERLSDDCKVVLADSANELYLSAASVWEIAVKRAKGRLSFDGSPLDVMAQMALIELPIGARHAEIAACLAPHHRDPFDRLLIAQAQVEDMTLVTHDELVRAYPVKLLSA